MRPCSAELAALESLKKFFYLLENYPRIFLWHAGSQVSNHCPLSYLFWAGGNTSEKTGLPGFWPSLTQTRLHNLRRWLEAWNFGFRKLRYHSICLAKTKALISLVVTAKLISWRSSYTVKPVLSGHSKIDKMKFLKTGCSLMQVP